jgi:hypothetical protein
MKRWAVAAGLAVGASGPVGAAAQDALPFVVQAIREHGCVMTGDQAAAVFPPLGITQDEMIDAVDVLVARGEAHLEQEQSVMVLSPSLCRPGAANPALRDLLVAELRAHDCALSEEQIPGLFSSRGYAPGEVFDEGQRMIADGLAALQGGGGRLVLAPALCRS